MSAPQPVNPHYLGSSRSNPRQNENPLVTFWKTQVVAPEHRADNLTSVIFVFQREVRADT
jgi:hypothetical protein